VFDVILFDLDGVIRHFETSGMPAVEEAAGLPIGSIRSAAFQRDLLLLATTGAISDEAWRDRIAEQLAAAHPDSSALEAVRRWSENIGRVDPVMLDLVRACRTRCRIGLVTNATTRLPTDLDALGISEEFDVIVNSSVIRAAKPDRRIFDHAVRTLESTHSRSMFIDDTPGHVAAARGYGLFGFVHESVDTTRGRLAELGLL
jgi:putative hydrolase of the HAD superfamily